jgi:hypothetical protein
VCGENGRAGTGWIQEAVREKRREKKDEFGMGLF